MQFVSENETIDSLISLAELCRSIGISEATGRNWVRLGKLIPAAEQNGRPYFDAGYADDFIGRLQNGENTSLKRRRSKKYISGNGIYRSYLSDSAAGYASVQKMLDTVSAGVPDLTQPVIQCILAECALQLFSGSGYFETRPESGAAPASGPFPEHLPDYLTAKQLPDMPSALIDDVLPERTLAESVTANYPELFRIRFSYETGEDLLGLLWLSLRNSGARKTSGAYYTPDRIVKKLCGQLFSGGQASGKTILDPCCGTGNFLLQLPGEIPFSVIYGNDIDPLGAKLARINMALKYRTCGYSELCTHITIQNYLNRTLQNQPDCGVPDKYDMIIGNPPWGFSYTKEEKIFLRQKYSCTRGTCVESCDLFVEQALSDLKPGGVLSFVLPEAVLNVKAHAPIRSLLMQKTSIRSVAYLGNVFDRVQCPCVILELLHTGVPMCSAGIRVTAGSSEFVIRTNRMLSPECFNFRIPDAEHSLLEKVLRIPNGKFLKGNAVFALGIVTGNNQKFISEAGPSAFEADSTEYEPVLRGTDLRRYRFAPSGRRIRFCPEQFQQTAPVRYYRAPEKLLYRFVSSQLVFAYDDRQTLSLNSCNILIPMLPGMNAKYIMAVLNSRIAQFCFRNMFHSVKVLRSHIEQIPIPEIKKEQQEDILTDVEHLLAAREPDAILRLYNQIDRKIADLYGLTSGEYDMILRSMEGINLFLTE